MSGFEVTLADRVRTRGVLSPDDAARLLLPVAGSLNLLHRSGEAHGSVSPAAVRIDPDGRARLLAPAEAPQDPAYRAPDPNFGLVPHPEAADVWSYGALLHLVVTGEPPARPGTEAPGSPDTGWLAPVLAAALQPDPTRRPGIDEVIDQLRPRRAHQPSTTTKPEESAAVEQAVPAPVAAPTARPSHRKPSPMGPTLVGAAVVAVLAVVGATLLLSSGGDDDSDRSRAGDQSAAPTSASTSTADTPAREGDEPTDTATEVTAGVLEEFARRYVRTASTDPGRGYVLLTTDYQRQSPRYHEVWAAIDNPQILSVTGDPDAMTVTYTYRYDLAGSGPRSEEVTLHLVERGDGFRISGATARPL